MGWAQAWLSVGYRKRKLLCSSDKETEDKRRETQDMRKTKRRETQDMRSLSASDLRGLGFIRSLSATHSRGA